MSNRKIWRRTWEEHFVEVSASLNGHYFVSFVPIGIGCIRVNRVSPPLVKCVGGDVGDECEELASHVVLVVIAVML